MVYLVIDMDIDDILLLYLCTLCLLYHTSLFPYFALYWTYIGMTFFFGLSGDIWDAVVYASQDVTALTLMAVYTFLAYIAINFHMALVQEFGGERL